MRTADLTTAVVLIAGSLLVLWDALRLGIGWGTDGPKSGFFPFWLALIMIGSCLVILVQAWRSADRQPFIRRGAMVPVLKMLVPAAAFVLATQLVGLYVASAIYMAFYMLWIGRHGWPLTALVSIGFPVLTFLVFERWFLLPLPKGFLESWLGFQ